MSSNGCKHLWRDMLSDLQQRASHWLKKIDKEMNESSIGGSGDNPNERLFSNISDDEFQQMFFHAVNNR